LDILQKAKNTMKKNNTYSRLQKKLNYKIPSKTVIDDFKHKTFLPV